ncbi:rhomboid family intramembrane serine protease [Bacillus sp. 03113]|uniref:rhomboid family intramembrane serine protease n=1 Tax=Bacillus sp. 03113 TaxID=2578211 RepID=UPI0011429193|nr:rhomboid family intramembrane serine protease [Bacillus sp. 03113]
MFTRNESLKEFIRFYPVVTFILSINILLYLLTTLPVFPNSWLYNMTVGVNLYILHGELWRIVTPIFMHSGFPHVLFNSFSLILFGPALERMLGKSRFLFLYLLTGILANVATFFFNPLTFVHVGSSGAIFGLFGFYVAIVVLKKELISRGNAQIILTVTIIGLIMTFIQPQINITAHIFGFLAGLVIGIIAFSKGQNVIKAFKMEVSSFKRAMIQNNRGISFRKLILLGGILILALIGILSR